MGKVLKFIRTPAGKVTLIAISLLFLIAATVAYGKSGGRDIVMTFGGSGYGINFDPETGNPSIQAGSYGCCGGSQCKEMSEIECSSEYGWGQNFYPGKNCNEVAECQEVCCLPQCKDVPKNWCSPEKGMGPEYVASPCNQADECEMGCCWMGGRAFQEQKVPCTSSGGQWSEGDCQKGFSVKMESTSKLNLDTFAAFGMSNEEVQAVKSMLEAYGPGAPESEMEMYIEAYTCDKNVNSTWTGKMKTAVTTCTSEGGCETKTNDGGTITMPFGEDGKYEFNGHFGAAQMEMKGEVDEEEVRLYIDYGLATPAEFVGKIQKGAIECLKKDNGNKGVNFDLWK